MKIKFRALQSWFAEQGFVDVAVMPAETELPNQAEFREWLREGRHGPLDYMENDIAGRLDITKQYPGARSVAIGVFNYFPGHHDAYRDDLKTPTQACAKVSRYAWGKDYHSVLRKKLEKIRKKILREAESPGENDGVSNGGWVSSFSDAQWVFERAWAQASGMGFIGKSSMFIHRNYGTWTFLAGLVTNIELESSFFEPMTDFCGSCTACIDACPTQAIVAPFQVDAGRCISTWTVEKPLEHEGDALVKGKGWAHGCDVCQEVCPWNRFEQKSLEKRFTDAPSIAYLSPFELGDMKGIADGDKRTKDERAWMQGRPLKRPGRDGVRRNIERAKAKTS